MSAAALPFLGFRAMDVAMLPAHVGRISFTGELGYEIWVPADCQLALYDAIVGAGADLGLRHFGARTLNSLRLEKSFGNWAREYRPIYTPAEAGLDRFVAIDKPDFVGRAAVLRDREHGPRGVSSRSSSTRPTPTRSATSPCGTTARSSAGSPPAAIGHCVGKSIALGYVPTALATATTGFEIEILGERRRASIAPQPLHDPAGERMRRS